MGISEMGQIGFFQLFWNFSNLPLSLGVWFFAIVGFTVQWLLIKKTKGRRWLILAGILAVGSFGCELAVQMVTGYDRLIPMLLYGVILSLSIGAAVAFGICFFGPYFTRK